MRRAILQSVGIAFIGVLLCSISLSVDKVSALGMGIVRFRGSLIFSEAWNDWACYGSYESYVMVQEIIGDPEGLLAIGLNLSVCCPTSHGLIAGEYIECYGYYYKKDGPMGCLTNVCCINAEYFVVRTANLADVNQDMVVNIFDIVKCAGAYGSTPSDPIAWDIHCDVAQPYWTVDIFDIVMISSHYGEKYTA